MEFLALNSAFGDLDLYKLNFEVLAFNTGAINLHKKFELQIECHFKEQHIKDFHFVDIYRLAITNNQWANMHKEMKTKLLQFLKD